MDTDLDQMTREELIAEVQKLRQGIREHRDGSRHELCWHAPALWGLLPERTDPLPLVPAWPAFIRGCVRIGSRSMRKRPTLRGPTSRMRSDGAAQLFGSSCDAHRAAQPGDAPDRAPMWGVLADALSRDLPDQREALHLTFALADTERLEHLLRTAGFRDLRVKRETRQGPLRLSTTPGPHRSRDGARCRRLISRFPH